MIKIKNLSKIQDGRTILDLGNIIVNPGEIQSLVGKADSGLDILLDLLIGASLPSAGEITINGIIPGQDQLDLKGKVGVLFKEDSLYTNQSAEKNLQFFASIYGLPKKSVSEVLIKIGLADQAKLKVGDLKSGLARRVALGRAILHRPSTLILNHPFARCDEDSLKFIRRIIQNEAEKDTAILILDEDTSHLEGLCSRIYFLKQGRIVESITGVEPQTADLPFKIPVKLEGKVALLNPGDILYAEASRGQTRLFTKDSQLPTQFTLQELEERLHRSGFFRAHRSYLVNLQHVKEVIPYSRNSFSLRLNDAERTEIPLSKNSAAELRDLLNY